MACCTCGAEVPLAAAGASKGYLVRRTCITSACSLPSLVQFDFPQKTAGFVPPNLHWRVGWRESNAATPKGVID